MKLHAEVYHKNYELCFVKMVFMPYADCLSLGLIQELVSAHLKIGLHCLISGQHRSQVKLRSCAGVSGATLSDYGM